MTKLVVWPIGKNWQDASVSEYVDWILDRSSDGGQTWAIDTASRIYGRGGEPPHKPISMTLEVTGLSGQLIRGRIILSDRLKFGVEGEFEA